MKKSIRILAVVLAATMLMCCCAFATDSWGCYCGNVSSSAYSSSSSNVHEIIAKFDGVIVHGDNSDEDISGYGRRVYDDYVDCTSGPYSALGATGNIASSHTIGYAHYNDYSGF